MKKFCSQIYVDAIFKSRNMAFHVLYVVVNHKKWFVYREHAPVLPNFILNVNRSDSTRLGFAIICHFLCKIISCFQNYYSVCKTSALFPYFSKIFLPVLHLWGKRNDLVGRFLPPDPTNSGLFFPAAFQM